MKALKRFLIILPVIAAMLISSIPLSANMSQSSSGGDNVGMSGNYYWDICVTSWGSHASGYYMSGSGNVHCYFYTSQGTVESTEYYSNSLYDIDNNPWVYTAGVDFYDA